MKRGIFNILYRTPIYIHVDKNTHTDKKKKKLCITVKSEKPEIQNDSSGLKSGVWMSVFSSGLREQGCLFTVSVSLGTA